MRLNCFFLIVVIGVWGGRWCDGASPLPPEPPGVPPWQAIGTYTHPPIRESSGVAVSRQFPDVYWTLNDSGNPPALYATKLDGELIREFSIQGATNRDWEALAVDDNGQLWVGEIGNNSRQRDDLTVYVVPEPNPFSDAEAKAVAQYPYRYPDENVDAEGLFVFDGFPYIVSKEPDRAILYRFTALRTGEVDVLERVGQLIDAKLVTGADLSADRKRLVVCTYEAVWTYHGETTDLAQMIRSQPWTITHDFGVEAVGFDGYDLVLTSESRNIYRLPHWWYEAELPLPSSDRVSAFSLLQTATVQDAELRTESYQEAGLDIGGGHLVVTADHPGARLNQVIEVPYTDRYELHGVLTRGTEYAQVALLVDDQAVGEVYDCYAPHPIAGSVVPFGVTSLKKGQNRITLQVIGKSPDAKGYKLGVDSYIVRRSSAFARHYLVLGPFPRVDRLTIDAPLPPETNLDVKGAFQGIDGRPIRWREAEADADGRLDLLASIGEEKAAVGYALTYVYSKADRDAALLVGSDDEVAVWVNGKEVHRNNTGRWATPDQDAVSCALKAGWNEILCKIGQNGGGWALYLRITDPDGILKYAVRPSGE